MTQGCDDASDESARRWVCQDQAQARKTEAEFCTAMRVPMPWSESFARLRDRSVEPSRLQSESTRAPESCWLRTAFFFSLPLPLSLSLF
eukprot:869949-Rhodomonas_salina.1